MPSPRLVDIDEEIVDRAARFLHDHMADRFGIETWRHLFDYPWFPERPSSGVALMSGEDVVGVLAAVYSRRKIDSETRIFCNICAWSVLPEFRRHSLSMLFRVTEGDGLVVTNLTPTPPLEKLFHALNYCVLDTHKLFLFPMTNLATAFLHGPAPHFITKLDEIARSVREPSAAVFRDHQDGICRHLLAVRGDDRCYLLFRRRVKRVAVFTEVLHLGNPALFVEFAERFVWKLLWMTRSPVLAVDSRFLARVSLRALPVRRTSFYLGESITPERIDNAYTELSVFPV